MPSNLVPEQRTDATGRTQRRWVRPSAAPAAPSIPSPSLPAAADAAGDGDVLARVLRRAMPESAENMFESISDSHPVLAEAYTKAAAYADSTGDVATFTALVHSYVPGQLIGIIAEDMPFLAVLASLPENSHRQERERYRWALGEVENSYRRYWGRHAAARRVGEVKPNPSREAPLLRAATVSGLLGVNEGRSSAFDEHAQIEAVLQDGDLLVRNLAPLQALTNQLGDRGIHADAETLVLPCRAKEEHGVADFEGVATAAVERGRLDPDEALRILLADAPALAEGLL